MARPGYQSYGPSSGENPLDDSGTLFQSMLGQLRRRAGEVGSSAQTTLGQLGQKLQSPEASAKLRGGFGLGATALGVAPGIIEGYQQGGLLGGATSAAAGLGTAALVSPVSSALMAAPHPLAKVAGFGLQAVAPMLAQAGTQQLLPRVTAGIPGAQEISGRSQEERTRDFERDQQRKDLESRSQVQLAQDKEYLQMMLNAEIQQQKAQLPIIEQLQRTQLVNAQSMLASQTAAYQQLGRSAMMGKMAVTGQQERGGIMRQALASNPYMSSIMSPQISFG